jgi:methylamine---corrinoid protein Co-methyltransferase
MPFSPKVKPQLVASVLEKTETGPLIEESDWDLQYIYQAIKELVDKYNISWEKGYYGVLSDDALADRVFQAGFELACRSGLYCVNTHRRMIWTAAELQSVLEGAPTQVTVGEGKDEVTFSKRNVEQNVRVGVIGGPYGIPVPEELFVPVVMSYAREPLFDIIDVPSLMTTYGYNIRGESPWDLVAIWQEVGLTFEALNKIGRPGMAVGCANSAASSFGELSSTSYGGFRRIDWHHNSIMSELKVSYADLVRAIHFVNTDTISHNFYNTIYGGFAGGAEGMAVAMVAGMILLRACLWGESFNPGPSHAHLSCNTFPAMIPSQAVAHQALARNTHLIMAGFTRPVAGPCVKEIFYEIAAITIAQVVSGIAFTKAIHTATGRFPLHCTPLEAIFTAQITHAAEGITRKEADPIVRSLVNRYKDVQKSLSSGVPFTEAYDMKTLQPREEWKNLYDQAIEEMRREYGLVIND